MKSKKPKRPPSPRRTEGRAVLVAGSAGSGKTSWTRQQVRTELRLLVWDSAGEWTRSGEVLPLRSLTELHQRVQMYIHADQAMRYGYVGPVTDAHFDAFCKLAWVWMRAHPRGVLLVEELADVTSPGKAPAAWGEIVRKHRHVAGTVYALTQRPAESDKTIVGNATIIHTGRMNMARDREYMAACLDIPLSEVSALPDLAYIERNMRTRELTVGTVSFAKK